MSSKARNFRRRAGGSDDDDNDNGNGSATPSTTGSTTTTTTTTTTKPQSKPTSAATGTAGGKAKKPPNQAPKKLLSFADDEDNDSTVSRPSSRPSSSSRSTKPSPSSSSHKLTASKDRLGPSSSSLPSNVQPQAGTYTKQALLELQKNTKTLASSRPPPSRDPKPPSFGPVIVLKGLVKPVINTNPIVENVKEVEDLEDDEENIDKRASFRKEKDDAATRLASIGLGKGRDSSSFPDQATIDAIRAKRERLRQSRAAAPDFIALDGGSNHGAAEGLSDEEPEFQGRIALFGEKMNSGKKGVFEDVDARAMDVGLREDDEVRNSDDEAEED